MAHHILIFRLFGAIPRLLLQALSPQLVLMLGVQPAEIAFVLMVNVAVSIAVILLYPSIAKHTSIERLLAIGAVLSAIGLASIAFAESSWTLTIAFCVAGGIGWALLGLQCPQHLVANLPPTSLAINMRALTAGPLVAGLIIPPAVLWISQFIRWQTAVLGMAVLTLVLCMISVASVPSGVRPSAAPDESDARSPLPTGARVGSAEYGAITLSGALAGFFALHFVMIVDETFANLNITAIALFASGLTTLASVFVFTRMQASGNLFRNLTIGTLLVSVLCLVTATSYRTPIGVVCLLAWPALSAGYFMHSMSVAAAYDKVARVSGHLIILHMASAGTGAYLFTLAIQATGSYVWPLRVVSALSLAVSLLVIAAAHRRVSTQK
jgi:predicted MFS family arabinose efflux permease